MKKEKNIYSIQTVEHALDVLEQFLCNVDELSISELSKLLRLNKNNVFRLLATLETRQYIEQDKNTENYRLGLKNLELGQKVVKQTSLQRESRSVLEELVRKCNETSDVAILHGGDVHCLGVVESTHPVRVVPRIGFKLPAYCTAAGKVILAIKAEEKADVITSIKEFRKYTPNTITEFSKFVRVLSRIAERGFAVEDEELNLEVRSVATPIFDYTRCVVGAVSVLGPTNRFNKSRIHEELVPLVKSAAEEISLRLGYLKINPE